MGVRAENFALTGVRAVDFGFAADAPAAPPFDPTTITGLQLWIAARKETIYADTDPVGTVAEWSGNNRTGTQGNSAKRPTYRTNAVGVQPAYRFDGTDDFVGFTNVLDSVFGGADKQWTIFQVVKPASVAEGAMLNRWNSTANFRQFYTRILSSKFVGLASNLNGAQFRGASSSTTLSASGVYVLSWERDGSLDTNDGLDRFVFEVNGAAQTETLDFTAGALGDTASSTASLVLGALNADTTPAQFLNADYAEGLVYSGLLSASDKAYVTSGLRSIYGV